MNITGDYAISDDGRTVVRGWTEDAEGYVTEVFDGNADGYGVYHDADGSGALMWMLDFLTFERALAFAKGLGK